MPVLFYKLFKFKDIKYFANDCLDLVKRVFVPKLVMFQTYFVNIKFELSCKEFLIIPSLGVIIFFKSSLLVFFRYAEKL